MSREDEEATFQEYGLLLVRLGWTPKRAARDVERLRQLAAEADHDPVLATALRELFAGMERFLEVLGGQIREDTESFQRPGKQE